MTIKYSSPLYILSLLLILAVFNKCANRVPPKGGPRDTIPPGMIYSNPENKSKNVHLRVFEFAFDERIQLKNLKQQLIITPRIDFEYETKTGKRDFFLIFDGDFADDVTYTFNFRDAVQDLTEGNPTENNTFSFSTGDVLDSLYIEGYAINLMSKDSIEKATIGLYRPEDTVTIHNGSPYYFTETDEEGKYRLENIKNGKYLLYGFQDENGNLTLQTKSESYGYIPDTINLKNHIDSLNVKFTNLDLREFKLNTANPSGKNFDINYNKYLIDYEVRPLDENIRLFTNKVKENKSIRIYRTFVNKDSTGVLVKATDSVYTQIQDTVWVKFNESSQSPEEFSITVDPPSNAEILENYSAEINLSKPFMNINTDSILFKYDTIIIDKIKSRDQVFTNKHYNKLYLLFDLDKKYIDSTAQLVDSLYQQKLAELQADTLGKEEEELPSEEQTSQGVKKTVSQAAQEQAKPKGLHLYLGKGAIVSIEEDSSQSKVLNYTFLNPEEYGILSGTIDTKYSSFILQLLTANNNNVVKEVYSKNKFEFKNIKPGDYKLRLLIDTNENGRWDYGNMKENESPEPVVYYRSSEGSMIITARANWQITDINFSYE